MAIEDQGLIKQIEGLRDHYTKNVNNRYLHRAISHLQLEADAWEKITALAEGSDYYSAENLSVPELYEMILAISKLIKKLRIEIKPQLRTLLYGPDAWKVRLEDKSKERVFQDMAISNFKDNINTMADLVSDLAEKTIEYDKRLYKGKPYLKEYPEILGIDRDLFGSK
ncbi:MAG: hypothetical protein ACLFR1_11020 [Spirochaetia bacterium]